MGLGEGGLLSGRLDLNNAAAVGQDEVGVGVGVGVLLVVEVQDRGAGNDAAGHRRDLTGHRAGLEDVHRQQVAERQGKRDPGAGDGGAAGAAIGVQHVAVQRDRHLAQRRAVHNGAQ
jgi:hypothetical protein